MANLDQALTTAVASIPECIAAGYIDLSTGMLMGMKTVDSQPADVIDILAAATADLFQGPNVRMIEDIFKRARGISSGGSHYFQQIIVNSENLLHVFIRGKNQQQVGCFVCRASANLGMALTKARGAMPGLEACL